MSNPIYLNAPVTGRWSELVAFTGRLADSAATCTSSYFRKPLEIFTKTDSSPVTRADRETEKILRDIIHKTYPTHGVLGEEHENHKMDSKDVWVIDPIDGTKSFIAGHPLYGTLIAYLQNNRVRIGAISMPAMDEFWIAAEGAGCYMNGEPCSVSDCRQLEDAILITTAPDLFSGQYGERFTRLGEKTRVRRYGGDCYMYAMVASGWADIVVEAGLQNYDFMAIIPVIEEAGGIVTDWTGKTLNLNSDGKVIAAATPELHKQALEFLS